jgi:hypothetical protein
MPELPENDFRLNLEFLEDQRALFMQIIWCASGQTFNMSTFCLKTDFCNYFFYAPTSALASAANGVLK